MVMYNAIARTHGGQVRPILVNAWVISWVMSCTSGCSLAAVPTNSSGTDVSRAWYVGVGCGMRKCCVVVL